MRSLNRRNRRALVASRHGRFMGLRHDRVATTEPCSVDGCCRAGSDVDRVSTRFDRRAFNLDFLASCGQSRRNLISRLNRAVRPQKSAAESPYPLGVLKTQAASRSQVPLAAHAAPIARYPVKRQRHKTHPHQKDSRRRAPTASARAFCRRNRPQNTLAQSGRIRSNPLSRKALRTDFATGLGVFRRRKPAV